MAKQKATNVTWHDGEISREDRFKILRQEGATVCMVTHNPEFAAMADRDAHLFDGRIVDQIEAPRLEATR